MKHLTVGLFHCDSLARELGKKGTESDIAFFNRKMDDHIFTFMAPVEDKIFAKSQIVSALDVAIVLFESMTRELGETVVLLNSVGVSTGMALTSPLATSDQISAITKGTSLESFHSIDPDPVRILERLKTIEPNRDTTSPALVVVDHSFSVKGVGEVLLGFVRKGVVRKYDKLSLLPANKDVTVRSVQLQDEDCEEAPAGARVGLAVKDATVEEMRRGSILTASNDIRIGTSLRLSFDKSQFYADEIKESGLNLTVDMQTVPVIIAERNQDSIVIKSEKPVAYTSESVFLLLDLNAKKTRIAGRGRAVED